MVPSQVLIEAVIAEVTLNDQLQYGVQWHWLKGGTPTATFSNAVTGGVAAAFPGFNYAVNAANIARDTECPELPDACQRDLDAFP